MPECLNWVLNHVDRIMSFIAIVISAIAIRDVRHLFRTTEARARTAILQELNNYGASMAALHLACQRIDFYPGEVNKQSAALLFATFRVQQLLNPMAAKEELDKLQKSTRKDVENKSWEYTEKFVSSGIGKLKDGYTLPKSPD